MNTGTHDDAPFVGAVAELLGERGFTQDRDTMAPWLTDWRGRYHGAAIGLASPANTGEVAALDAIMRETPCPDRSARGE